MTDKEQIIVDGINVSGCKHFLKDTEGQDYDTDEFIKGCCEAKGSCIGYEFAGYGLCRGDKDCYFKQLARKTQECEQIKEKYEALKLENQEGYEIVAELKQECEKLKRKLSNQEQLYQNEIEIYNESCLQLRQENDDLYLERLALNTANSGINALLEVKEQECDRYRKALDEIAEYAKENDEMLQGYHHEWANNRQILDIINKAKGEGICSMKI